MRAGSFAAAGAGTPTPWGGVGMVALDDVFMAHAETSNLAGALDAYSSGCAALASSPPSFELADAGART